MSQIGLVIVLIAFSSWVILSFLARDLINKYKFHLLGIGIILTVLVLYCFAEYINHIGEVGAGIFVGEWFFQKFVKTSHHEKSPSDKATDEGNR
jgi:hypothetical protein